MGQGVSVYIREFLEVLEVFPNEILDKFEKDWFHETFEEMLRRSEVFSRRVSGTDQDERHHPE